MDARMGLGMGLGMAPVGSGGDPGPPPGGNSRMMTVGDTEAVPDMLGYSSGDYNIPVVFGALDDRRFPLNEDALIDVIVTGQLGEDAVTQFALLSEWPNSGWTSITINGTTLLRADAVFSSTPSVTLWSWFVYAPVTLGATVEVSWD